MIHLLSPFIYTQPAAEGNGPGFIRAKVAGVKVTTSGRSQTSKRPTSDAFDPDGEPTLLATLGTFVLYVKILWLLIRIWSSEGTNAWIIMGLALS